MKSLFILLLCVACVHAFVAYEHIEGNQRFTFHAQEYYPNYELFLSNRTMTCTSRRWTCWLNQEASWSMVISSSSSGCDSLLHTPNLTRAKFYFVVDDRDSYPSALGQIIQAAEIPGFTVECSSHAWRCEFATE